MDTFVKYILGELRMIADAPVSYVVAVVATALLIWWAMEWRYSGVISNRDSEINVIKTQRDAYREKLSGASPDQAAQRIDSLTREVANLRAREDHAHPFSKGFEAPVSLRRAFHFFTPIRLSGSHLLRCAVGRLSLL
jgi:hypothetical protein